MIGVEFSVTDFNALGTVIRVAVGPGGDLDAARSAVEEVVRGIDLTCSRFRDDSELMVVNRSAGMLLEVSPLLGRALSVALDAARSSQGLVDPTIGNALIELGYDRDFKTLPDDGPIAEPPVAPCPGWWTIEWDRDTRVLRVPAGTTLDLGSTAKALAADQAATAAAAVAGAGVLVSCGGDIAMVGPCPDGGWVIQISEDPHGVAEPTGPKVYVDDGGMATSGTRTRRWRRGGAERHHIIDPSTGHPVEEYWRTVTVVAASCIEANIASTAALILGPAAPQWLRRRRLPGRLIDSDGNTTIVAGWPQMEEAHTA